MSIFTCTIFFRRDWIFSRTLLGLGAVASVLLAIFTGYGVLFICGVPFTSITQILPFIMFGIGLDDAFIIMGAYHRTKGEIMDRVYETIEEVGASIFLTTFTSMLAFGLGCISTVPGIQSLCLYAVPTLFFNFLYQL